MGLTAYTCFAKAMFFLRFPVNVLRAVLWCTLLSEHKAVIIHKAIIICSASDINMLEVALTDVSSFSHSLLTLS